MRTAYCDHRPVDAKEQLRLLEEATDDATFGRVGPSRAEVYRLGGISLLGEEVE